MAHTQHPMGQNQARVNGHQPPQIPPGAVVIQLVYDPASKQFQLTCPIQNWPLCFELLDMAKQQIMQIHSNAIKQQATGGIIAAPAAALNQLDKLGGE